MMDTEDIYLLTPTQWNPHDDSYAANEENMLDWEGNMVERKDRKRVLLSEVAEDTATTASAQVSAIENQAIDSVLQRSNQTAEEKVQPCWQPIPLEADEVVIALAAVSPTLDDQTLHALLQERADLGRFQMSIGSTNAMLGSHLVSDTESQGDESPISDSEAIDDIFEEASMGEINLDEAMLGAAHAGKTTGVDPAVLAKLWRIDLKTAERTLEVTTQNCKRVDNPTLARNYGTNDRML